MTNLTHMGELTLSVDVGTFSFLWDDAERLTRIEWRPKEGAQRVRAHGHRVPAYLFKLLESFERYFDDGQPIASIPWDHIAMDSWTEFQRQVYTWAPRIPHGETRPYSWVAEKLGKPLACRAVGQALRKNPVMILVPCHRVVSAQGMGGFMGKADPTNVEMALKKRLIEIERLYCNPLFPFWPKPEPSVTVASA